MAKPHTTRLQSVDVLRGLAIAGMIVVNNPGDALYAYPLLHHATWNGCTVADFVFPLFLFLVGVCVALAVNREAVLSGQAPGFWPKVLRRAVILFLLGLLENAYLHLSFDKLRIPGVLQRIAVVYLAVVWLHVRLGRRGIASVIVSILVGSWLLLAFVPVPGLGHPSLGMDVNWQGWLDQLLLGDHIWKFNTAWDPEGVLSTFPAIALGLIGLLAGSWLRSGGQGTGRAMAWGVATLLLGFGWSVWFPINKSLCTSSFVLVTGGAGVLLLAVCHWLLDGGRQGLGTKPLLVLGQNPLTIYVTASFIASTLRQFKLPDATSGIISLQAFLFRWLFSGWTDKPAASLAWGVLFLLPLLLGAWVLHARRIVLRV
ncbi:acyltransferase family protein [Desulfovibrio sp. TomC]|uniref:acyltransferase family protein n=1 Tax=Desulfovibrio sp. TomC TaxID=1562888 RepID=UPI000573F196|nr:heparan-alpha-glucosaminide N-acetyltransferase domain-containing protein [Desulfovibrio sp. TomC]KHK04517.1 N-acetylglucosamine related transporter, NagX [Desulfovibrio sp. TomC]